MIDRLKREKGSAPLSGQNANDVHTRPQLSPAVKDEVLAAVDRWYFGCIDVDGLEERLKGISKLLSPSLNREGSDWGGEKRQSSAQVELCAE